MRSKVIVTKGKGKAPAPKRKKYRKVDCSKKLAAKTRLRLNQMKIFRTKTKSPHRESKLQTRGPILKPLKPNNRWTRIYVKSATYRH